MSEEDFVAADKEDLQKIGKAYSLEEEIRFFNIQQEDVFSSQDQFKDEDIVEKTDDISIYPSGIRFFNKENIGTLFTLETLTKPSFLEEGIDLINEVISSWRKEKLLKHCCIPSRLTEMVIYLFHSSFAIDDSTLLQDIKMKIFHLTDSVSRSFLSTFIDIFIQDLSNLGGNMHCLEELQIWTTQSTATSSSSIPNYDLNCCFRHIFEVLVHLLKIESIVTEKDSTCPQSQLDKLLITLMIVAQDPLLINSDIQFEITACIRMILELYSQEEFIYQESVVNAVDKVGIYWDNKMVDAKFPHEAASHVCSDLLPMTPRGNRLIASMAYYSLMCCLDLQDTSLLYDVTVSELSHFCNTHFQKIRDLDCSTLCSFVLLMNCCIKGPIEGQPEKDNLSWLIEVVRAIADSKQKKQAKEPSEFRLQGFARTATKEWEKLLKKKKENLKQTRMIDFMSQENDLDASFGQINLL